MKKYNKTQLRKDQTKAVLSLLVEDFNAYSITNDDGARFDFYVDFKDATFHGQLDRRGFDVCLFDSIKLHGDGFTAEERQHQANAVELEDKINREIRLLMASESMFDHEESFINWMNR